jgi:ketosteroid isomerase-like protein
MPRNPDIDLILFANEAFYAAFANGDIDAMNEIWAESAPCVCLHPGATPLYNRATIMQSWDDILTDPGVIEMVMHSPRVIQHEGFAQVVCYETLGGGTLVACNAFIKENGQWRMVSHQAGPCPDAPDDIDDDDDEVAPSLH